MSVGDFPKDTLDYFLVKDPKSPRFYLITKIHKRLHDEAGRPMISNCGYILIFWLSLVTIQSESQTVH